MPITINGNGTIGGVSVGGLPDGTVDTDMLAANAVTEPKLGADQASGLAKAWAYVDSGAAINKSFNIASCTYTAGAIYDYTFTTAMPDANYAVVIGHNRSDSSGELRAYLKTTTGFRVYSNNSGGTGAQALDHSIAVFT
jgi:hypothetical protein